MKLLLAAGVQAVKVVNDSALHVRVINTPLPVHIMNGEDPIAVTGLKVAIAALVVAVVTLLGVGYQIYLARQELKAVNTDLANNTKQFKEFMKRPKLSANIAVITSQRNPNVGGTYFDAAVFPEVMNAGDRAVDNCLFEMLVPANELRQGTPASECRDIQGTTYAVKTWPELDRIYPNNIPLRITATTWSCKPGARLIEALWRIYDNLGSYPPKEYGRVEFAIPAEEPPS